jgi:membrane protein implicated in regulation of membrane protease activity
VAVEEKAMEWLDDIVFWHWWILAGVLLILELTSPGFFFLWLGFSAAAVGFLLLVFPKIPVEGQLVLFGILSVVAVLAWRRYREVRPPESEQPLLNQRGRQYVGRTFTLQNAIINGVGKVEVDDSTWRVNGPDLGQGARVRGLIGPIKVVRWCSPWISKLAQVHFIRPLFCALLVRSPGMRPMCNPAGVPPTGVTVKTPTACSITTNTRSS